MAGSPWEKTLDATELASIRDELFRMAERAKRARAEDEARLSGDHWKVTFTPKPPPGFFPYTPVTSPSPPSVDDDWSTVPLVLPAGVGRVTIKPAIITDDFKSDGYERFPEYYTRKLAKALCDTSAHYNTLPDVDRPCAEHMALAERVVKQYNAPDSYQEDSR